MNFKKWFNKNYFKENLKKSKGLLAFFFGIIPLINILMLVIEVMNSHDELLMMNFKGISIFNYLGQYFIPFILAVALFGFVFKQKSVDFVMSKPINRKTIYRTNIIGGILVILLFTLINTGIYDIAGLLCKSLVIPMGLILDYFVYWFVAYTFLFTVSSLAISLAGNIMGSIVVILIIVCMAPFLFVEDALIANTRDISYYVKCTDTSCIPKNYDCHNNKTCIKHLAKNEYKIEVERNYSMTLTSPFALLDEDLMIYRDTYYTTSGVLKMSVLSIIYSLVGGLLFVKRKMENNEVSFKNPKLHYAVKTLTMIPVCFIFYFLVREMFGLGLIISIVAALIYYGIYDLITRKELYKPLKSAMICICTLGIFLGLYTIQDVFYKDVVVLKKPKEITFLYDGTKIKDKNLINKMLQETLDTELINKNNYAGTYKKVNYIFKVTEETKKEIEANFDKNLKNYYDNYDFNKINYLDNNVPVTKELKKLIKETVKSTNYKEILSSNNSFTVYKYENHHYDTIYVKYGKNAKLDKYIMDYKNKQYVSFIDKVNIKNIEFYPQNSNTLNKEDYYLLDYILEKNISKFTDYLENNNNVFDGESIIIEAYSRNRGIKILIASQKSFVEELNKYKEALKDDETYHNLRRSIIEEESNEY